MGVRTHVEAEREALESIEYFRTHSETLGEEFNELLQETIRKAVAHPNRGRLLHQPNFRAVEIHRFKYRVYYQILDDGILILSVASTRRQPAHWHDRAE